MIKTMLKKLSNNQGYLLPHVIKTLLNLCLFDFKNLQELELVNGDKMLTHILHVQQVEPSQVELVRSYGVFLSQPQLDAAVSNGNNPTKLMRTLLSCFFTPAVLAESTAYGSRSARPQLDSQILNACISKCFLS